VWVLRVLISGLCFAPFLQATYAQPTVVLFITLDAENLIPHTEFRAVFPWFGALERRKDSYRPLSLKMH